MRRLLWLPFIIVLIISTVAMIYSLFEALLPPQRSAAEGFSGGPITYDCNYPQKLDSRIRCISHWQRGHHLCDNMGQILHLKSKALLSKEWG